MRHHNFKLWLKCGTEFPHNSKTNASIITEGFFFLLFYILMPYNIILYFRLPYFHVSKSALFST